MLHRVLTAVFAALVAVPFMASTASAASTFGPYPGGSVDSGSCGNNWANDTYQRTFTASVVSGVVMVTETFSNGRFTTLAGKSAGACQAGPDNGGTIAAAVRGSFSGSESGPVTCGAIACVVPVGPVTIPPALLVPPNTTDGFIKAIFGATATFNTTTFRFNYSADCGQSLVLRTWQNADPGSGGNVGDIKSAPGQVLPNPCPTPVATPTPALPNASALPPTRTPVSLVLLSLLILSGAGLIMVRRR